MRMSQHGNSMMENDEEALDISEMIRRGWIVQAAIYFVYGILSIKWEQQTAGPAVVTHN
jgi:hypothetical protein